MGKVAIVTDSNSGITQKEAKDLGVYVIPMPFYINEELFFEDISLSQEDFYRRLGEDAEISTSTPALGDVKELWDKLLKDYDEIIHIPMSSGLSSSCAAAESLAKEEYQGRVFVVDNKRISVPQKQSVLDAKTMAEAGWDAEKIRDRLIDMCYDSSIYITLDTLTHLRKGGRITPAVAAIGTLLHIKPILQIQGSKLDTFAKCRTKKAAREMMIQVIKRDCRDRFGSAEPFDDIHIEMAYSGLCTEETESWREQILEAFPTHTDMISDPLSLSVSCHTGAGVLGIACTKKLKLQEEI